MLFVNFLCHTHKNALTNVDFCWKIKFSRLLQWYTFISMFYNVQFIIKYGSVVSIMSRLWHVQGESRFKS